MNKMQKKIMVVGGILVAVALLTYGIVSLMDKLAQMRELNERTAVLEASSTPAPEATPDPAGSSTPTEWVQVTPTQPPTETALDESSGESAQADGVNPSQEPAPTSVVVKPSEMTTEMPASPKPQPTDTGAKQQAVIDAAVLVKIEDLRIRCSATSDGLVAQILAELGKKEEVSVDDLNSGYLGKIFQEEAKCDGQFGALMAEAKAMYLEAGLDVDQMPSWQADYEQAKAAARAQALAVISGALQ